MTGWHDPCRAAAASLGMCRPYHLRAHSQKVFGAAASGSSKAARTAACAYAARLWPAPLLPLSAQHALLQLSPSSLQRAHVAAASAGGNLVCDGLAQAAGLRAGRGARRRRRASLAGAAARRERERRQRRDERAGLRGCGRRRQLQAAQQLQERGILLPDLLRLRPAHPPSSTGRRAPLPAQQCRALWRCSALQRRQPRTTRARRACASSPGSDASAAAASNASGH